MITARGSQTPAARPELRLGYASYSSDFTAPGDRRRFAGYAGARGLGVERADPARRYDVVVVSATADLVTWAARPRGELIVYDIVDSYLADRSATRNLLRGLGGFALGDLRRPVLSYRRAIERICRRADAVVCATDEQREAIAAFCPNVHVILDLQDEVVRGVKSDFTAGETLNLFWEGLPYTLGHFATISEVLRRFGRERPLAVHLMSSLSFGRWSGRVGRVQTRSLVDSLFETAYLYEWNAQLLSSLATGCDLAVIPLDLGDAFARGKPANKLLSMWRMGVPTLASATPAYTRAMAAAGLEMSCRDGEDWLHQLRRYAADEGARREAAAHGRAFAERHHGSEQVLSRWDRVLASIGHEPAHRRAASASATHSNSARSPSSNGTDGA